MEVQNLHCSSDKTTRKQKLSCILQKTLDFLEDSKFVNYKKKYNKFMPIPIKFGTKKKHFHTRRCSDLKPEEVEVDNIINNPNPAWTKQPSELTDEDYKISTTNCIQCNLKNHFSTSI
jgi:molecular chaperone HtpG